MSIGDDRQGVKLDIGLSIGRAMIIAERGEFVDEF